MILIANLNARLLFLGSTLMCLMLMVLCQGLLTFCKLNAIRQLSGLSQDRQAFERSNLYYITCYNICFKMPVEYVPLPLEQGYWQTSDNNLESRSKGWSNVYWSVGGHLRWEILKTWVLENKILY